MGEQAFPNPKTRAVSEVRSRVSPAPSASRLACLVGVALLLVAQGGRAAAETKKAFELTDGSSVIGVVLDELETGYLVRKDDGSTVTIQFEDVAAVYTLDEGGSSRALSISESARRGPIESLSGGMYSIGDDVGDGAIVRKALREDPRLLRMFIQGETASTVGGVLLIPTASLTTVGLVLTIAQQPEKYTWRAWWNEIPAVIFFVTSATCGITALIFGADGDRKKKQALRLHNASVAFTGDAAAAQLAFSF